MGTPRGGLLAVWLSAYGLPGSIRGAHCQDPPIFTSEVNTSCGDSFRQNDIAQVFELYSKFLGDQWSVGDWAGLQAAARGLPSGLAAMVGLGVADTPTQSLKEYDPEWARAFCTGTIGASCDHARMLAAVKAPILYTHHFRQIDPETGKTMGAASDRQAGSACQLMRSAGQRIEYRSFPTMGHGMHGQGPQLFAQTLDGVNRKMSETIAIRTFLLGFVPSAAWQGQAQVLKEPYPSMARWLSTSWAIEVSRLRWRGVRLRQQYRTMPKSWSWDGTVTKPQWKAKTVCVCCGAIMDVST